MKNDILLNILILSPLLSALFIFFINIFFVNTRQYIFTILALLGSGVSALLALYVSYYSYFYSKIFSSHFFTWLNVGEFSIELSFRADSLSSFMLLFVAPVSFLIHIYATGYMNKDKSYGRFFAYFNLFIFFMFILVLADNPIVMFIGWEGVGLTSYALVSFYFEDIKNTYAGNKAFILNRIGDFGFLSALMILFIEIGSGGFSFETIFVNLHQIDNQSVNLIAFLLFVGAMGKSAQIPLFVWLPDAMAGPTPVSALIHAATMVTAGVYMITRFAPLYNIAIDISLFISYIGALSALFAAIVASRQYDIKKILAYSTMSQLGFMFMALGVHAYSTALFHMFTHAFFKALLFMVAGAIIVSFSHKQDIRELRGIKYSAPLLFIMMGVGAITISAIPPFSSFFSKDAIMSSLYVSSHYELFAIAFVASLLTAYYMFRMLFVIFFTKSFQDGKQNAKSMIYPMLILTFLSLFSGFLNFPEIFLGDLNVSSWLNLADKKVLIEHSTEIILMFVNTVCIMAVIYFTYKRYAYTDKILQESEVSIVANKFYIDEIYDVVFVKPLQYLSIFINKTISYTMIDRSINIIAFSYAKAGRLFSYIENGNVRYYALYMAIGLMFGFVYLYVLLGTRL